MTKEDVESALEVYSKEYYNFKISDIEYLTDFHIERNKRNYQKQKDHLEEARAIRDIRMKRQNKDWREGNGRKSAKPIIVEFLYKNPEATKAEVIRGTGLSKPTVYKYYETAKEEAQLMKARTVAEGVDMELQMVISKFEKLQKEGRMDHVIK